MSGVSGSAIWIRFSSLFLLLVFLAGCTAGLTDPTVPAGSNSNNAAQPLPFRQAATVAQIESTLPAGTPVPIRLQTSISSRTASPGDHFDAVLAEDLENEGRVVVARGTEVTGHVVAVGRSGRLQNPGYLRLTLASMDLKGKEVQLQTSSIFVQGRSHKQRNLAIIGGGAGGGALIGAFAGGGNGTLIGAALGTAGGTGAAYATGRMEAGVAAERRLTFRLVQPLIVKN